MVKNKFCFLIVDSAKNVLYIPLDGSYTSCCLKDACYKYAKDSELVKRHKNLRELDKTIHDYIKGLDDDNLEK